MQEGTEKAQVLMFTDFCMIRQETFDDTSGHWFRATLLLTTAYYPHFWELLIYAQGSAGIIKRDADIAATGHTAGLALVLVAAGFAPHALVAAALAMADRQRHWLLLGQPDGPCGTFQRAGT